MFRNIKQLSEYSPLSERFVYQGNQDNKEKPEIEPSMAERLKTLKESMGDAFKKHLEDYRAAIMEFINSEEAKNYESGEWKKWNVKLLEYMGYKDVSEEDAARVITRLQEYLQKTDKSVEVDGQFGPGLLKAIKDYYKESDKKEGLDRRKGADEYLTNAEKGPGVRRFYRYPDGTFTDEKGNVLAAADVVPKIYRHKLKADLDAGDKTEKDVELYGVDIKDGKVACYRKDNFSLVSVLDEKDTNPSAPQAPEPIPVTPQPAPQPAPESPSAPQKTPSPTVPPKPENPATPGQPPAPLPPTGPAPEPPRPDLVAENVGSKALLLSIIDRMPPQALPDIKYLMVQAVELMDPATIDRAAGQLAGSLNLPVIPGLPGFGFPIPLGPLATWGAQQVNPEMKKELVRNMIRGAKTTEDIKRLIGYIDDASFDAELQKAISNPDAVTRFTKNPENTYVAKRMVVEILRVVPPLGQKQMLEEIIMHADPREIAFIKSLIKTQINRASDAMLALLEPTRDQVVREKFDDVNAWFIIAAMDAHFITTARVKEEAMAYVDTLQQADLLKMIDGMNPVMVRNMIAMVVNSWDFNNTLGATAKREDQTVIGPLVLKSARILMRAPRG